MAESSHTSLRHQRPRVQTHRYVNGRVPGLLHGRLLRRRERHPAAVDDHTAPASRGAGGHAHPPSVVVDHQRVVQVGVDRGGVLQAGQERLLALLRTHAGRDEAMRQRALQLGRVFKLESSPVHSYQIDRALFTLSAVSCGC